MKITSLLIASTAVAASLLRGRKLTTTNNDSEPADLWGASIPAEDASIWGGDDNPSVWDATSSSKSTNSNLCTDCPATCVQVAAGNFAPKAGYYVEQGASFSQRQTVASGEGPAPSDGYFCEDGLSSFHTRSTAGQKWVNHDSDGKFTEVLALKTAQRGPLKDVELGDLWENVKKTERCVRLGIKSRSRNRKHKYYVCPSR